MKQHTWVKQAQGRERTEQTYCQLAKTTRRKEQLTKSDAQLDETITTNQHNALQSWIQNVGRLATYKEYVQSNTKPKTTRLGGPTKAKHNWTMTTQHDGRAKRKTKRQIANAIRENCQKTCRGFAHERQREICSRAPALKKNTEQSQAHSEANKANAKIEQTKANLVRYCSSAKREQFCMSLCFSTQNGHRKGRKILEILANIPRERLYEPENIT